MKAIRVWLLLTLVAIASAACAAENPETLASRILEAVGHPVQRLVRTRIGPLTDRKLKPRAWRELTTEEVRALERASSPGSTDPKGPAPSRADRRAGASSPADEASPPDGADR